MEAGQSDIVKHTNRGQASCVPLEGFPPISPPSFLSAGRIVRSWALSHSLLPGLIGTLSGRESQQGDIFLFLLEGCVLGLSAGVAECYRTCQRLCCGSDITIVFTNRTRSD